MKTGIFTFLLAAFLVGCSTTTVRDSPGRVAVAPEVEVEAAPLAEALLDHVRGVKIQTLDAVWNEKSFTGEVVLKGDGTNLTGVVLAPQMRLATLTLARPHQVTFERARILPEALAPEYVIADFAFVNLPTPVLAAALGPAFRVRERGRVRTVTYGGQLVCTRECRPDGEYVFTNPSRGYTCRIRESSGEE